MKKAEIAPDISDLHTEFTKCATSQQLMNQQISKDIEGLHENIKELRHEMGQRKKTFWSVALTVIGILIPLCYTVINQQSTFQDSLDARQSLQIEELNKKLDAINYNLSLEITKLKYNNSK